MRLNRAICAPALAWSAFGAAVLSLMATPSAAQVLQPPAERIPLTVASNIDPATLAPVGGFIELTFNRPLLPDDGDVIVVVGGTDVSAVAERIGARIVYRPALLSLPGETEVIVYRRPRGEARGRWSELRRFPMKVAAAAGFTRIAATKSATLGNKGQVAEGRSRGLPEPERRTFQDFVLNAGLQSSHASQRWSVETQSNYVGVSRRQEALRFGTKGPDAPLVDLSNYLVSLHAPQTTISVGHVGFGTSRHLANGYTARGGSVAWTRGSTTLTAGALNGSSQVGWSDMVGLDQPTNRILGASIAQEVVPAKPGLLHVDFTVVDGSVLPRTSFTQGAVVDAEESGGGSLQLSAAAPNQRLRFAGGYSRSRFGNPRRDAQLVGDTNIRPVRPVTRGARFVELNAALLQNARLPLAGPTNLTIGWRHERVDPLYRSVAAPTSADRQQHSAEVSASIGALMAQVSETWSRDNLADVPSILTTNGRGGTANLAVPLASLLRAAGHAALWPMITVTFNRTHQFAAAPPATVFRPTDLPDQVSLNSDVSGLWQIGRWRFTLRTNRSTQDNRQQLRELADFASGVDAMSLGLALGARGDVALDLGSEHQTAKERNETTRVRRLTLNASFRPGATTNLIGALSALRSVPPAGSATFTGEQRLELSQGIRVWRDAGAPRAQAFVRYARTTSLLPDFALVQSNPAARTNRRQWSLSSGLNLRVF